jgi:hypothetical protein
MGEPLLEKGAVSMVPGSVQHTRPCRIRKAWFLTRTYQALTPV